MYSKDVKTGQTVLWKGQPYTVVDQHPWVGHWWLADSETGRVSSSWFAPARDLTLVDDPYRPGTVVHGHLVRGRAGDWIVRTDKAGYRVTHEHTGASPRYLFASKSRADQAAVLLAEQGPAPCAEGALQALRGVQQMVEALV